MEAYHLFLQRNRLPFYAELFSGFHLLSTARNPCNYRLTQNRVVCVSACNLDETGLQRLLKDGHYVIQTVGGCSREAGMGSRHNGAPMRRGGRAVEEIACERSPKSRVTWTRFGRLNTRWVAAFRVPRAPYLRQRWVIPAKRWELTGGSGRLPDVDEQSVTSALRHKMCRVIAQQNVPHNLLEACLVFRSPV